MVDHIVDEVDALPLEVEDFLTHLAVEKGRSTNTLVSYRRDLRYYLAHIRKQGRTLHDVTAERDRLRRRVVQLADELRQLRSQDVTGYNLTAKAAA